MRYIIIPLLIIVCIIGGYNFIMMNTEPTFLQVLSIAVLGTVIAILVSYYILCPILDFIIKHW